MCRSLPPSHDVSPDLTRWCPRERSSGLPPFWGSERVAVLDLRTLEVDDSTGATGRVTTECDQTEVRSVSMAILGPSISNSGIGTGTHLSALSRLRFLVARLTLAEHPGPAGL